MAVNNVSLHLPFSFWALVLSPGCTLESSDSTVSDSDLIGLGDRQGDLKAPQVILNAQSRFKNTDLGDGNIYTHTYLSNQTKRRKLNRV